MKQNKITTDQPTPSNNRESEQEQTGELLAGFQLWEVHKSRKSGTGNVGYCYCVLMPLITREGEYKGQLGGYHVVVHQDIGLTKEQAENICNVHNKEVEESKNMYHALKALANLDLRGVTGEIVYQRNNSVITVKDVQEAKAILSRINTNK